MTVPTKPGLYGSQEEAKKFTEAVRKAEGDIKGLIIYYVLMNWEPTALAANVQMVILAFINSLPKYADRRAFADGMWQAFYRWKGVAQTAASFVERAYRADPSLGAKAIKAIMERGVPLANATVEARQLGAKARQAVYWMAGDEPLVRTGDAIRPVSQWAEAEMEVRWEEQKKRLAESASQPGDLRRISVHLNCSPRCMPDQGKVVSMTLPAVDGTLWTGTVAPKGERVYSLTAMLNRTDKYGWHNFILSGFNCRHYLRAYESGPQDEPSKYDASETYDKETQMRAMERKLREAYSKYLAAAAVSKTAAVPLYRAWADGVARYEKFALANDLMPQGYRCK